MITSYIELSDKKNPAAKFSPRESAILGTIANKAAASETIEQLIDFLFATTQAVAPCDRIGFALLEDQDMRMTSRYVTTDYEPIILDEGYSEDIRDSTLQKVIEKGTPRVINDLAEYAKSNPSSRSTRLVLKEGVRSSITCPLTVNGRNVGVLFRSSRKPNAYDEHQVYLHQAISENISAVVEKTVQIEQLKKANNAYVELLAIVSHEIKNPLASVASNVHLLLEGYVGKLSPEQEVKIESMGYKAKYLLRMVREFLDLARIETGEMKPSFVEVPDFANDIIEEAVNLVLPEVEAQDMRLTGEFQDEPVSVICDPNLLRIVVINLLNNAVRYGREGGEICVRFETSAKTLRLTVWNEGIGFEEKEKKMLFQKFSRIPRSEKSGSYAKDIGTGVGLYAVWRIIQMHGGHITANSESGKWAEFSFSLPQPLPREILLASN